MKSQQLLNNFGADTSQDDATPPPIILVTPIKSYSCLKLEMRNLQDTMSVNGSGLARPIQLPTAGNQKMQLPAFQRKRPCQDNRPQVGLKNGRILPLDTCDFAPKYHPAGHQLKIKSSSKLDFLTNCIIVVFLSANG